jgi:hypothetical protein
MSDRRPQRRLRLGSLLWILVAIAGLIVLIVLRAQPTKATVPTKTAATA